VSSVQGAHRRHQADALSRAAIREQNGTNFRNGGEDAGKHEEGGGGEREKGRKGEREKGRKGRMMNGGWEVEKI